MFRECTDRNGEGIVDYDEQDWKDEVEQENAKDVWLPEGEMAKFLDAKAAFQVAGYRIRRAELVESHPVWFFLLLPATADYVVDSKKSLHHLRDIMWPVGIYFRDRDAMIQPCGKQISVSFLWPTPARGKGRIAAWEGTQLQKILAYVP